MKKRRGQALIIVVIIIAVVMAVFANSLTTRLRYHSREETEIYQREQALYLAEMGINQMIFNMNSGTPYSDNEFITGSMDTGTYKTTYHAVDDPEFGGSGYIESTGTVGKFTRIVYASVQSGGSKEAFKYCLYTTPGGNDGVDDANFHNDIWKVPTEYKYNLPPGSITPYPDSAFYNNNYAFRRKPDKENNYMVKNGKGDLTKTIYIEDKDATLTIDFSNVSPIDSFSLSIITDAKNVTIKNLYPSSQSSITWSGAENSKDNNLVYPIITHLGTGELKFDYNNNRDDNTTLRLDGFIYTAGYIYMNYGVGSSGEINGEVIEKNPKKKLGGKGGDTKINYTTNYYETPPPHFIVPNGLTSVLPGSFREEY